MEALSEGRIAYALRLDPAGHIVADLTVWRTGPQSFELMSGRHEEVANLLACAGPAVEVADLSGSRAVFAVQGPGSLDSLRRIGDVRSIERLRYFQFCYSDFAGFPCKIGRLGYTGEAGFEVIVALRHAHDLWHALSAGARPAGFIAADLLRIEAGFVLFTNEFRLPVTPGEAGLAKFRRSADIPPPRMKLISFRADADDLRWPWAPSGALRRPAVPGEIVVTSACESIVAGGILGLGYVLANTPASARPHDPAATFRNIRPTAMPFFDTAKRRPRAPWR